jgi:hypothetical protein
MGAIETASVRERIYIPLKESLVGVKNIVEYETPEIWGYATLRRLVRLRAESQCLAPEVREYINSMYSLAVNHLRSSPLVPHLDGQSDHEYIESLGTLAQQEMYRAYDEMVDEEPSAELPKANFVSFEELADCSPDLKLSKNGYTKDVRSMWIQSRAHNAWYPMSLPISDNLIKKGGEARLLLKKFAGAPPEIEDNELPINDSDGIAIGKREDRLAESRILGIDPDGLEMVREIDIPRLLNSRDLDINAALLTHSGLYFTDQAYNAAQTGHIRLYTNDRGIFGPIVFYYDDHELATNRGFGRLAKTVAERKALSFDWIALNNNIDFGIYWLIYARKYQRKYNNHPVNFGIMMQRYGHLGAQTGQIRPSEHTLMDVLNRAHEEHPNFDFDDPPLDEVGVARWLNRYLYKSLLRDYRHRHHVPRSFDYERFDGDTQPYKISLQGFEPNFDEALDMSENWDNFLDRCRERRQEFLQSQQKGKVV